MCVFLAFRCFHNGSGYFQRAIVIFLSAGNCSLPRRPHLSSSSVLLAVTAERDRMCKCLSRSIRLCVCVCRSHPLHAYHCAQLRACPSPSPSTSPPLVRLRLRRWRWRQRRCCRRCCLVDSFVCVVNIILRLCLCSDSAWLTVCLSPSASASASAPLSLSPFLLALPWQVLLFAALFLPHLTFY